MEVLNFQLVAPPRSSYPDSSQKMLRPVAAVERPVLDGFGDVRGADGLGALEVGDGTRDFQNAVVGAGAQTQAGHGVFEQAFALGGNIAIFADLSGAHLGVAVNLFTLVALELAAPGRHHPRANLVGGVAARVVPQLAVLDGGHVDMDVNAVEQRSRDF